MKKDIHPKYYPNAKVECACGNTFNVGATKQLIKTEACSQCHTFYTGKEKNLDRVGQVQKFKKRLLAQQKAPKKKKKKKSKNKDKNKNGS